jgi:predicted ABC-type ATPase
LKFLREARQAGYFVSVHFLGLDSAQLAIARVAQRVEAGGHDVPDDKILTRYPRTLANLRSLLDLADEVTLYDNSYLDQPFRPVAFLREGRLLDLARSVPSWTATLGLEGRIGPHTRRSWP